MVTLKKTSPPQHPSIVSLAWHAIVRVLIEEIGKLVLLIGEPGTGKTTFFAHWIASDRSQGGRPF